MILKKGSTGVNVRKLQKYLHKFGYFNYPVFTLYFGSVTLKALKRFQTENDLVPDGIAGSKTFKVLGITFDKNQTSKYDEKYKGVTIRGSVFPDKPIKSNLSIRLNSEIKFEYIPTLNQVMRFDPKGFRLLCTIMAYKEGFRKGTRSYRTNNPGNIGNTDSGANKHNGTLESGVLMQKSYILKVANGKHSAYPMGKRKRIRPYFSPEIAKHTKLYGMSPYVPGYDFIFTGQLDQFVKIYATGARAGNSYLSMIISFFKKNGIDINAQSKIQDIIKME